MNRLTPLNRLYLIARCPPSTTHKSVPIQANSVRVTVENRRIDCKNGYTAGKNKTTHSKRSPRKFRSSASCTTLSHHLAETNINSLHRRDLPIHRISSCHRSMDDDNNGRKERKDDGMEMDDDGAEFSISIQAGDRQTLTHT